MGESLICGHAIESPTVVFEGHLSFKTLPVVIFRVFSDCFRVLCQMWSWWQSGEFLPLLRLTEQLLLGCQLTFICGFMIYGEQSKDTTPPVCASSTVFSRLHCGPRLRGGVVPMGRKKCTLLFQKKTSKKALFEYISWWNLPGHSKVMHFWELLILDSISCVMF